MAQKAICPNCYKTNLYEYEKPHVCGYCAKSFVSAFTTLPATPTLPPILASAKSKHVNLRVQSQHIEEDNGEQDSQGNIIDTSQGITKYRLNLDDPNRRTTVKDLMNGQGGGARQLRAGASLERSQADIQQIRQQMSQGNQAPVYVIGDGKEV